jgi:hypothetical protein
MRRTILLLSVIALPLVSCGPETDEGQDTELTGAPGASASATAATGSPTASPTPEYLLDYAFPPWDEVVELWDYDTSEPLGYGVIGNEREEGATVYDVEYQSSGYTVPAYLVIPDGPAPFPSVLHAHSAGESPDWYLEDALALAREGYASLLITSPETREPYLPISLTYDLRADVRGMVRYVIDLRRGLDLLGTLPEIDGERIGFIGYGDGGWAGAILSGIETRIDAYVLVTTGGWPCSGAEGSGTVCGVPDPSWFAGAGVPTGAALERYVQGIMVIDSVPYISHSAGSTFLFQASKGKGSGSLAVERYRVLYEAAPEPKSLEWYESAECYRDCDPALPSFKSHRAWLQENV